MPSPLRHHLLALLQRRALRLTLALMAALWLAAVPALAHQVSSATADDHCAHGDAPAHDGAGHADSQCPQLCQPLIAASFASPAPLAATTPAPRRLPPACNTTIPPPLYRPPIASAA